MINQITIRKRHENAIKDVEAKQESYKDSLNKIQQQLAQAKLKMTLKS
jgi:prefoldin subunit 5